MRDIKFDYIIKRNDGIIGHRVWSLNNLEFGDTAEWYLIMLKNNSKVISKRQYTGLLDKNGVEIYEGDIVKSIAWIGADENLLTVQFSNSQWSFESDNYRVPAYNRCLDFEVIGNIYESPELLQ